VVTFLKHTCKPMEVYHSKFGQQKISQDFKDCMLSIIVLRFVGFFHLRISYDNFHKGNRKTNCNHTIQLHVR
jgi:hypothetical protein